MKRLFIPKIALRCMIERIWDENMIEMLDEAIICGIRAGRSKGT